MPDNQSTRGENTQRPPTHQLDMAGGSDFEVPGVRGRMERLEFAGGLVLYRLEFEALKDCTLQVQSSFDEPWMGSALHIQGRSTMVLPTGQEYPLNPDRALLMRVDPSGTCFRLKAGELVRHIGVSTTITSLARRYGGSLPTDLNEFTPNYGNTCVVNAVPPSARLRNIAALIYSPQTDGLSRHLMLEGYAGVLLAEAIELCCSLPLRRTVFAHWEKQALADVMQWITESLDQPLSAPILAEKAGLKESRLDQLFRHTQNRSCAEYIRQERMTLAHALLRTGEYPVKVVAAQSGYNHVSNFSRAYRAHFGESPARTLRRGQGGTL